MENSNQIKYKKIYSDLIKKKFPEKANLLKSYLHKKELSQLDVIEINQKIFGKSQEEYSKTNQKLKAYNPEHIYQILEFQKTHQLNNTELAEHFNMSRNTVAAWKRKYLV
ncbi:helix-turn-helix domain-containing protein [Moheibacter lacus]|uniref:Helix-turn-helix domain-containing protein n=1 Tax=Moheibacter lacus TaxID=2745851 RepID=A0A838ZU11_9FLAO|nr:helix-turn-helix domain-containing protein [Moheibacter lacus]MBA5630495.1 helix-turn-helix domain-containing protein [Moheibacter lacus]